MKKKEYKVVFTSKILKDDIDVYAWGETPQNAAAKVLREWYLGLGEKGDIVSISEMPYRPTLFEVFFKWLIGLGKRKEGSL